MKIAHSERLLKLAAMAVDEMAQDAFEMNCAPGPVHDELKALVLAIIAENKGDSK